MLARSRKRIDRASFASLASSSTSPSRPRPSSSLSPTFKKKKNHSRVQFVIHDFLNPALDAKLYSETFVIGGHPWNILAYPRGNKQDNLALYVNAADAGGGAAASSQQENGDPNAAAAAQDWGPRRAWFKLSLLHPSGDEARASHREATHTFVPTAVDWGFTNFLPLSDVKAEFVHPDGSIVVRCELSTDPSVVPAEVLPLGGFLSNQHYDCRRETGHGKEEEFSPFFFESLKAERGREEGKSAPLSRFLSFSFALEGALGEKGRARGRKNERERE